MKKIIIILIFVCLSTSRLYAAELDDCSKYNKLNPKYLACKAANFAKDAKNYQTEQWSKEKNKNKKKD